MSWRADALADRCETAIKTRVLIGHAEAHRQSLHQFLSNPDNVPG